MICGFNIRLQVWTKIDGADTMPMPRAESQVWQDNWSYVYMYREVGASGNLADFCRFSTQTMMRKTLPSAPDPCYGAVTRVSQNHLFLCGGIGHPGFLAFNTTTAQRHMLDAPSVEPYGQVPGKFTCGRA